MPGWMRCVVLLKRTLVAYWKSIGLILPPILLVALPAYFQTKESKCAYVIILMAVYWVTEVAPLPVTALLPVALFPLLDVADAEIICGAYLKATNFIFVGGLIMAVALEQSNLHQRIALRVLLFMGAEPRWIMLGCMSTTAFLSMWMSNTATAAMMVPIAIVILEEIVRHSDVKVKVIVGERSVVVPPQETVKKRKRQERRFQHLTVGKQRPHIDSPFLRERKWMKADQGTQTEAEEDSSEISGEPPAPLPKQREQPIGPIPEFSNLPPHVQGICKATLLCIAYGANLGGIGTLTGTGPNLIFLSTFKQYYSSDDQPVSYLTWLLFGTPEMIICCFLGWMWLVLLFGGWKTLFGECCSKKKTEDKVHQALLQKYNELGKLSFAEWSVAFWFVVLILLWMLREPVFVPGWDKWLKIKKRYTNDACAGMLIAVILFVFPNEKPDFWWYRPNKRKSPRLRRSLVTWENMQTKFSWGVIILLGGGFALAEGVKVSGLSDKISHYLKCHMGTMDPLPTMVIFLTLVTFVTEIASNVATASIFVPVVFTVANSMRVNPLYFGLPTTLAASFAFMLPVATPPNAIVYESNMITVKDMAIAGFVMNILCIGVSMLNMHTWSEALFKMSQLPAWAETDVMMFNVSEECTEV